MDELPVDSWLQIIEMLSTRASSFTVYGGEPLLYDGLDTMLRKIRDAGFSTRVTTTAPPMLIRMLDTGILDGVNVSIDTLRYDSSAAVPHDSAQKSRWGVNAVSRFGDRTGMTNFVGITVSDWNVGEVRGILDWLKGTNFRASLNLVQVDSTGKKSLASRDSSVSRANVDAVSQLLD